MTTKLTLLAACIYFAIASSAVAALSDPTRPAHYRATPATAPAAMPTLRVEAIMRSNETFIAIVNGKLVRVGERVDDAVIQIITAAHVQYTLDGRTHTAKLPRVDLKVRRNSTEVGQ